MTRARTVSGASPNEPASAPLPKALTASAATPVACGEAIEVPCRKAYHPQSSGAVWLVAHTLMTPLALPTLVIWPFAVA